PAPAPTTTSSAPAASRTPPRCAKSATGPFILAGHGCGLRPGLTCGRCRRQPCSAAPARLVPPALLPGRRPLWERPRGQSTANEGRWARNPGYLLILAGHAFTGMLFAQSLPTPSSAQSLPQSEPSIVTPPVSTSATATVSSHLPALASTS